MEASDLKREAPTTGSLSKPLLEQDLKVINKSGQIPKRSMFTYSNPSPQMLNDLESRRKKHLGKRLFSKMPPGSLRAVVINFIRMTTGIGIMVLPFYVAQFGLIMGGVFLVLAGLTTYSAFIFSFEASHFTKQRKLVDIVKQLLPRPVWSIYRITLMIDLAIPPASYVVVGWNIFTFLLYIFGFAKKEWVIDPYKLEFNQYKFTS